MEKFDLTQSLDPKTTFGFHQPPGGLTWDLNSPKPKIGQPLPQQPEPEHAPEEDPSKKKKKKNIYEITC